MAWAFFKGAAQGVLNTVNGVQDIGVGLLNLGIQTSGPGLIARAVGHPIPTIESPDWSRGKITDESDGVHSASKIIGGNALLIMPWMKLPAVASGWARAAGFGHSAAAMEAAEVASTGSLLAKTGETKIIPLHNTNVPWYQYVTPRYNATFSVVTQGRTAAQIARTTSHELQHVADVLSHPQLTSLMARPSYFPGAGLVRYIFELRGYSAGGTLTSLATPLRSFSALQKLWLGYDVSIVGGFGILSAADDYFFGDTP